MRQWNEVEASFAHYYHMSLGDIFDTSWRRFRVLFSGVFSWKGEDDDEELEVGRISSMVDWNQAQHVPVQELGSGISVNRIPVGKGNGG